MENKTPVAYVPIETEPFISATQLKQKNTIIILLIFLVVVLSGATAYLVFQNMQLSNLIREVKTSMASNDCVQPNEDSTFVIPTPTPTNESTPSATPMSFDAEEKLMRKTLAGFLMYVGNSNTAGALSFFTPAKAESAIEKYENIRTENLPYGLSSWSFVTDSNGKLSTEEIKGGYRVRVYECRTDNNSCPILLLELVRDSNAENGFSVDRYYTTAYMYQSNLGEEIKYQGFGL